MVVLYSFTNEKTQREKTCSMMNSKWGAELGQEMVPLAPGFEGGDMGGIWNSECLAITRENLESSSSMGEYLWWMVNTSMSNLEQLHLFSSLLSASFPTVVFQKWYHLLSF